MAKPKKKTTKKQAAKKKPAKKKADAKKKKAAKKPAAKKAAKKKPATKKPAKKKADKKPAKPAKKPAAKKPSAKKKSAKKRSVTKVWDPIGDHCKSEDSRLGVKVDRKGCPASDIVGFRDALALRTEREIDSLQRRHASRPELMSRISLFSNKLITSLGDQIDVSIRLGDSGEVCVSTAFKTAKGQHPMDGDAAVDEAYRSSGLDRLMELLGTGTMISTKVRDHDFSEKAIRFD